LIYQIFDSYLFAPEGDAGIRWGFL